MYTPVNPSFTIKKWGVRGCRLHGRVCMIGSKLHVFSLKLAGLISTIGSASWLVLGSSHVQFLGPAQLFISCQSLVSTEYCLTA